MHLLKNGAEKYLPFQTAFLFYHKPFKKSSIISYSRNALEKIHTDIEKFAEAEHLTAHANSIKVRFEK